MYFLLENGNFSMLLLVFQGCTYLDYNSLPKYWVFSKKIFVSSSLDPQDGNYPHTFFHCSCSQALTNHCVMYCRHRMDNIIPRLDVAAGTLRSLVLAIRVETCGKKQVCLNDDCSIFFCVSYEKGCYI